ncbi:MAG: response regulator transcription factor [Spirochaetota bacterium]|nr:response regulator transcription factor [Spirochaetota bacterium]
MKILVVEDKPELAQVIKKGLKDQSYAVDLASTGLEGLHLSEVYDYDAMILDVMLPEMDGFTVLTKIRENKNTVPVLMLTARGELEDRLRGLNSGADDYLTKPFVFPELLARLQAVIRRSKGKSSPVIEIADLVLNANNKSVRRKDQDISLSTREFNILEHLVINRDRIVSRAELMESLYDMDNDLESNVIDVYINYLRKKIDRDFELKLIHTVRGAGYMMSEKSQEGKD